MSEVVKKNKAELANLDYGEYGGVGFESQTSEDMAIPFLGLLQALSPQVQDGDPSRIEGAKPGDLIDTVAGEILKSPVAIVPCYTAQVYVEWVPRDTGGGLVAVHQLGSDVVTEARRNAVGRSLQTEAGNDLIQTFYMYALRLDEKDATESVSPIVIAFTSTKIKAYRKLMTKLRTVKGNLPLFAHRVAISSIDERNKQNQPYKNFKLEPLFGSVSESIILPDSPAAGLLDEGFALHQAICEGHARAAYESQEPSPEGDEVPF